jgi:hypothetical protein
MPSSRQTNVAYIQGMFSLCSWKAMSGVAFLRVLELFKTVGPPAA